MKLTITNRPAREGLWIYLKLRDGREMHGTTPNNLMALQTAATIPIDPVGERKPRLARKVLRQLIQRSDIELAIVLGVVGGKMLGFK